MKGVKQQRAVCKPVAGLIAVWGSAQQAASRNIKLSQTGRSWSEDLYREHHHVGCCSLAAKALVGPMRPLQALTASSLPSTMAYSGPLVMNSTSLGKKDLPCKISKDHHLSTNGITSQVPSDLSHLVFRIKFFCPFLAQLQKVRFQARRVSTGGGSP